MDKRTPIIKAKKGHTGDHLRRTRKTGRKIKIIKSHGGPRQCTPEQCIAALKATTGNISASARRLGLERSDFVKSYIEKFPEVKDSIIEARTVWIDETEDMLQHKCRKGEPWAICFSLKTQAKDRGYVEKMEIGGRLEGLTIAIAGLPKDLSGADL